MGKKVLCNFCKKPISFSNLSRHQKFQHIFCEQCKIFASFKKHHCFKIEHCGKLTCSSRSISNKYMCEENFFTILVPVMVSKTAVDFLKKVGAVYFDEQLSPDHHILSFHSSTDKPFQIELIAKFCSWIREKSKENCLACYEFFEDIVGHSCFLSGNYAAIVNEYFDECCDNFNLKLMNDYCGFKFKVIENLKVM